MSDSIPTRQAQRSRRAPASDTPSGMRDRWLPPHVLEPDIQSTVHQITPRARRSPLPGYEHQRGWGILACPFASGHVLALRVSPQNDFAPFVSIWHRTPDGAWSIYVDGPRLDTACPRYWSAATAHVGFAEITIDWTTPHELAIEMNEPPLQWTASMTAGPFVRVANAIASRLPEAALRLPQTIRWMERISDTVFGLGTITLAPRVPNGQDALVVTRRLFPITDGHAQFDGDDLGSLATMPDTPRFGAARLPARPVFTIGPGYLTIIDEDDYERTLAETRRDRRDAQTDRVTHNPIDRAGDR